MSKQQEALQFLDDLDSFSVPPEPPASGSSKARSAPAANPGEAADVLAFLDEITQKSSEPTAKVTHTTPSRPLSRTTVPSAGTPRKSGELGAVRVTAPLAPSRGSTPIPGSSAPGSVYASAAESQGQQSTQSQQQQQQGGWGWGSVWSGAAAAIQQAKSAVEERVPKNEQARKWGEGVMEYVKQAQLEKIGQDLKNVSLSTLTDILNVVAPPIAEHEVIKVWLSHDMQGYDGVETLVYRALARIMEQVEGGDLIVNKGDESRPKDTPEAEGRSINGVEGLEAAFKLAQAEVDELVKARASKETSSEQSSVAANLQNPTVYSTVYLRIQPFVSPSPLASLLSTSSATLSPPAPNTDQIQFLLHLIDPTHTLEHTTLTQAVPAWWLASWDAAGADETKVDAHVEWVEEMVAEVLRVGVEVIGQEYVAARMGWVPRDKEATESA
ncbi:hypothetical protein BOTBODRAFT_100261 [Botryobasidium botryosum FD-172 SS1]|uniref:Maintenance of telomere capping protein 1 n=1 Tax=Botryobasidium botryosum (strain FD-172 SS1) TaxID=930990 RepID=A0A067MXS1_BOTB1|nr:hypothetical protein BOTBODRAFT_100261 [Botryobasidium botryosum FD-172 SS1]